MLSKGATEGASVESLAMCFPRELQKGHQSNPLSRKMMLAKMTHRDFIVEGWSSGDSDSARRQSDGPRHRHGIGVRLQRTVRAHRPMRSSAHRRALLSVRALNVFLGSLYSPLGFPMSGCMDVTLYWSTLMQPRETALGVHAI